MRAGALDFEDLITHAHALLSRAEAAPWVLYKLDGGIDHILIDEGQDTSPAQWDLIAPLQQELFSGAGGRDVTRTVFAVGDPKQSIYGFQGADPQRFLRERQTLRRTRARKPPSKHFAARAAKHHSAPRRKSSALWIPCSRQARSRAGAPGKYDEVRHLPSRENEAGLVEVWPLAMRPERGTG